VAFDGLIVTLSVSFDPTFNKTEVFGSTIPAVCTIGVCSHETMMHKMKAMQAKFKTVFFIKVKFNWQ